MREVNLDKLLEVGIGGHAVEVKRKRKPHPAGWVPGVHIGASGGSIVTDPLEIAPSDWSALLLELLPPGMNPDDYSVDGESVEVRAWDSGDGDGGTKRLYYFKAKICKRGADAGGVDLDDVIAAVKRAKPKPLIAAVSERVYWVQITDLQAGQSDGDGIEGMAGRVLQLGELVKHDIDFLKRAKKPASQIFVPITGDLVEGIVGWYAMQQFSVTLDRRDQVKLVRRLLTELLLSISSLGLPVHVAVVPGNHGENRKDGKAFTTLGDNDDVALVEQIAEAFALHGSMQHVTFSFPARDRLSLTVEILGHVIGLTHGHVAQGGTGTEGKILNWFKSMAASRDPIGDSELLFTGHYHHARHQQLIGETWWIQGGAMCDTSAWFSQSFGLVSDPVVMKGTITREQVLEFVLPYTWPRSRVESTEISE